jgi:undecaprenyl diphosphate synthase
MGHNGGLRAAKKIVQTACELGLPFLTLYVFSTENWKRTAEEVGFIMGLVKQYLRGEMDFFRERRIRIRYTGNEPGLPPDIQQEIRDVVEDTRDFPGLQVVLALNYGGRDEILRAMGRFLAGNFGGMPPNGGPPCERDFHRYLDNPDIPDPDLIIRTAGEFRTSNFLLWEGAYAEYYISEKFWPDFGPGDFKAAIGQYQTRKRKYGGTGT